MADLLSPSERKVLRIDHETCEHRGGKFDQFLILKRIFHIFENGQHRPHRDRPARRQSSQAPALSDRCVTLQNPLHRLRDPALWLPWISRNRNRRLICSQCYGTSSSFRIPKEIEFRFLNHFWGFFWNLAKGIEIHNS